jgi:hypothetical protein
MELFSLRDLWGVQFEEWGDPSPVWFGEWNGLINHQLMPGHIVSVMCTMESVP